MAAYEFILHSKIFDITQLTSDERNRFNHSYLFNAFIVFFGLRRFFSAHQYEHIVMYNSYYGLNHLACVLAKKQGIKASFIHGGFNLEKKYDSLYFSKEMPSQWSLDLMDYYKAQSAQIPIDFRFYTYPLDHISYVLQAKSVHTYSSSRKKNIPEKFLSLKSTFKKIVLVSLSSGDESYAADYSGEFGNYLSRARGAFKSQLEWLAALLTFAKQNPDVAFIFRFHPREFPNWRKMRMSKNIEHLNRLFENVPKNVVLNVPDDQTSIYDLFTMIDLHLCAQTTVGLESCWFGIPTMAYITGLGNYPIDEIALFESTETAYFQKLDQLLSSPFQPATSAIEKSLRWLIFLHKYVVYNFKSSKVTFISRAKKRILSYVMNRFSYFLGTISSVDGEDSKLFSFFEKDLELFPMTDQFYKENKISNEIGNPPFYRKYLFGLFKIWTGVDFLESLDPATLFSYEKTSKASSVQISFDSISTPTLTNSVLTLPLNDTVMKTLAEAFVQTNPNPV